VQHSRIHGGRRAKGLERRQPEVDHELKLAPVLAVGEDAYVAAVAQRHAGVDRGAHAGALGDEGLRLGRARLPSPVAAVRLVRGDGRAEQGAVLPHEPEYLGRSRVAVLDRLHAGHHRAPHSFRRHGVRDNRPPRARRDFDDPLQLIEREGRPELAARARAVVGVDLDPVGASSDLIAHDAHERRVVGLLGALQHVDLRSEPRPVAARRHDRARDHDHSRSGNDPLRDGALQPHVGIAGALRAEVAHRGEPGAERLTRVVRRARHAERERLVQHLVVPGRLVVGVEQEVRVSLDQPGEQRRARERDPAHGRWRGERSGRSGRGDAFAAHEHRPSFAHVGTVEHPVGHEQRGAAVGGGARLRSRQAGCRAERGERERTERLRECHRAPRIGV